MIQKAFARTVKNVVKQLNTDVEIGLTKKEALQRITFFGANEIPQKKPKKRWRILFDQFINLIIYILSAAAFLAFIFGDWLEGIAILVVILITVTIGFIMELQAIHSLETLRKMGQSLTTVLRNGKIVGIKSSQIVPGDIILLNTGDVISADARIISHENLTVKEASLTGESIPVEKNTEPLAENTLLVDQNNMVFRGTFVNRGAAKVVVTATGINTELGKIEQLGLASTPSITPLEKKLNQLSKWLIILMLLLAFLIILVGYIRGKDLILMIQTGIALAVASIPEGLPIVATIALAQGMIRLSKKKVIIKKLEAVQTLGATNIICTDKTGTLTEDQMRVHTLVFEDQIIEDSYHKNNDFYNSLKSHKAFNELVMTGVLCNDAILTNENRHGDTMDLALIEFAEFAGYNPLLIQKNNPEKMEVAFDTDRKMMATVNQNKEHFNVYSKGAFESIINCCNTIIKNNKKVDFNNKKEWHKTVDNLAIQGFRTLAFAYKETDNPAHETLFEQLTFIGVIGFIDPAREDVKSTVTTYKNAGIRVIMMTGDHPGTAKKIAEETGLLEPNTPLNNIITGKNLSDFNKLSELETTKLLNTPVFARVTPKQKLDIITLFQQNNNTVGMIGDGINDVPALIKADIGIAMGIRGTQAAREAANVILKDDKFTTIELAIRQGRAIYENIRQFVVYLLSSNLAEIISVGFAALLNLPSPLLPLQILFLNLITDIFPALALGLGKGEKGIMQQVPRKPDEPIITFKLWNATLIYGLSITAAVLGITAYTFFVLKLPTSEINNMAFFTLIFAQLLNVFNVPKRHISFFKNEVTKNPWIWAAILLCILLTLGAYFTPILAKALSLVPLSLNKFGLIVLFGFSSLALTQFIKRLGGTI